MKHILKFVGITAVAGIGFVAGVIGTAIAYGKDGSVSRGTELGDATNNLRESLDALKGEKKPKILS